MHETTMANATFGRKFLQTWGVSFDDAPRLFRMVHECTTVLEGDELEKFVNVVKEASAVRLGLNLVRLSQALLAAAEAEAVACACSHCGEARRVSSLKEAKYHEKGYFAGRAAVRALIELGGRDGALTVQTLVRGEMYAAKEGHSRLREMEAREAAKWGMFP